MADLNAMRQNIIAHLEQCLTVAYGAGHHFAQHGKHAPSSKMAQADADAKLIHLIEDYAKARAGESLLRELLAEQDAVKAAEHRAADIGCEVNYAPLRALWARVRAHVAGVTANRAECIRPADTDGGSNG